MSEPSFELAYQYAMVDEGGYSNNPNDKGKETYRGIARNMNPDWPGWKLIDAITRTPSFEAVLASDSTIQAEVVSFYQQRYWRCSGTNIPQAIASKLFDHEINEEADGVKGPAILSLQRALGITADGVWGQGTITAIEDADAEKLRQRWTAELCLHYFALNQPVFLRGWIERACRWPG